MINHPSTVSVGLGCPTAAPAKPLGGTLGGTYRLLLLGATVGVLGAAAYRAVASWLLCPAWFRRLTTAAASAAVVGSMLVRDVGELA